MGQLFLLFFLFVVGKTCAQESRLITGRWLKIPKEDLIIEVYKSEDAYKGKIIWIKDTAANKQIGFQILEGLKFNADKKIWTNGKIRNPLSGATYKATAKIQADGTLEVLAYKGMKFIGRRKYFKRVK
jgi:uncharacterized protein (DUF2147 family)